MRHGLPRYKFTVTVSVGERKHVRIVSATGEASARIQAVDLLRSQGVTGATLEGVVSCTLQT